MLKKSASGVLASLRGSTYRNVRLASSLAAALLDSLFEHPATIVTSASYVRFYSRVMYNTELFHSQLDTFQLFKRREASGFRDMSQYQGAEVKRLAALRWHSASHHRLADSSLIKP